MKRRLLSLCAIFLLVGSLIGATYFLYSSINDMWILANSKETILENKTFYGNIVDKDNDYIVVEDKDTKEQYKIKIKDKFNVGDYLKITVKEAKDNVINKSKIKVITSSSKEKETTTTTIITTIKTSTSTTSTTTKTTTKVTTTQSTEENDQKVINYLKERKDEINTSSYKDNLKSTFITIVDFIFNGGTIKGVTFNDLSESAKVKVIYYTLLIDSKIESIYPDYKESIGTSANNIKEKLIAKYLDLTTNLCAKHPDDCEEAMSDFKDLKTSMGFTWDLLKGAFSYAYDKGASKLKDWYKIFAGE